MLRLDQGSDRALAREGPVGLDRCATTSGEIAVAILAEIVGPARGTACRRVEADPPAQLDLTTRRHPWPG